ncbi:MAG: hypothetical protein GWO10_21870, partial [candidate division Zixibacteria bacterium]|nr:hypothetical protein [candidate division Zixibacteria bacterium]
MKIAPGIEPVPDNTNLSSMRWIDGDKVRFVNGNAAKIGGWEKAIFNQSEINTLIKGAPRMLFSITRGTDKFLLIGTNEKLYLFYNGSLYNITPLQTSLIAIANSLDTNYTTLANNPITTTSGSDVAEVSHPGHKLYDGDIIKISGVPGPINGIPASEFNTTHTVYNSDRDAGTYQIRTTTFATASGSGGGAAVIEETSIITVNQAAHGYVEGDRVKIQSATSVGGIPASEINAEHIIRNEATNTYDIVAATIATSSVTGGG